MWRVVLHHVIVGLNLQPDDNIGQQHSTAQQPHRPATYFFSVKRKKPEANTGVILLGQEVIQVFQAGDVDDLLTQQGGTMGDSICTAQ
jgi:hypothetical protein